MKRSFIAALTLCAAWYTHSRAGERPLVTQVDPIPAPAPVDFDPGRLQRIQDWQAELAAREFEIERAQTAWLPPRTVGPITENVVRDRSTFGDYFVMTGAPFVPTPTYVVDWRLAERRWYAYRPYPYVTAPVAAPVAWQPSYPVGYPQAVPDVVASPRVNREVVRSIGDSQTETFGTQASRPPAADWR
jgi:hypothetical protein